jgi:hypothetical protein
MRYSTFCGAAIVLIALSSAASATTFTFNTPPFAGADVRNIPGRQIVGGEDFISFSTATDIFSLESTVFNVGSDLNFANGSVSALPQSANVVVLESLDNDNNPLTPFGAGQAADLIASRITTPGPGFFIYFNQSLNLPRLVYSTDLSSSTADLQILARMLNLFGAEGQNALPNFTAANFEITTASPEPASFFLMTSALGVCCCVLRRKRGGADSLVSNPPR